MAMPNEDSAFPTRMRPRILAILLATVLLLTALTFVGAQRYFSRQALEEAQSQLLLYVRSLNDALNQHQHLPFILAQNPAIVRGVTHGETGALNEILRSFSTAAELEAIYLMGLDGTVVASSNAGQPGSFLGQNYGFRPYFRDAAAGKRSDYFAIGATTGRPGYFVAEPMRAASGDIVGVAAIKLDTSELQAAWEARAETVLAVNPDGIVVLSARPEWLYLDIGQMTPERLRDVTASRQFGNLPLTALDWSPAGSTRVVVEGERFVLASNAARWRGWTVHYLLPEALVQRQTLLATAFMGTLIAVLIGFATFLRSQRIAMALQASQKHRRELIETNARLIAAQQELARTSKLAALGQLAASVTHELGQPISALKNHLAAAEIGDEIRSPQTAGNLRRLAERMETTLSQLRHFARAPGTKATVVDLSTTLREAVALMRHEFSGAEVTLRAPGNTGPKLVRGRQIALEQALVNLLKNALQATDSQGGPSVEVGLTTEKDQHVVTVADTGAGLNGKSLADLQEPFFSTKPSGVGMGLGLAITADIVREHGGSMTARNADEGGAVFAIRLPAVEDTHEQG